MIIRERLEKQEEQTLSPYAVQSRNSQGRQRFEDPDPVRTCFMRDRDRIIHCKAFRRLKHKTQVFLDPEDHYRTRLTHTLEVAQIARTISRALRLNDDLTEAIALAHDLGHTPFGHAGESALEEALKEFLPDAEFRHYEQSLRVVDVLERNGAGLNLTEEVRDGISHHSKGRGDLSDQEFAKTNSLEAAAVRFADRIAYVNHDLDDAIRARILSFEDVPKDLIDQLGQTHGDRIATMVTDVIENSIDSPEIHMSQPTRLATDRLKDFLFERVYLGYMPTQLELRKGRALIKTLFRHFMDTPEDLPPRFQPQSSDLADKAQGVCDYVAGMTDRFAAQTFEKLYMPKGWSAL